MTRIFNWVVWRGCAIAGCRHFYLLTGQKVHRQATALYSWPLWNFDRGFLVLILFLVLLHERSEFIRP